MVFLYSILTYFLTNLIRLIFGPWVFLVLKWLEEPLQWLVNPLPSFPIINHSMFPSTSSSIYIFFILVITIITITSPLDLNPMQALVKIPRSEPPKLEGNYSSSFKDFVAQCLIKDPTKVIRNLYRVLYLWFGIDYITSDSFITACRDPQRLFFLNMSL